MVNRVTQQKYYFEDFSVGDVFVSDSYKMTKEEIKEFALKYDPQVFHIDEEQAEDTFFKGLSASGWHTAAVSMRLITESLPFADGVIGTSGEIKWPRPTRPGDVLHVKSTVKEMRPSRSKSDRGRVVVECETYNQHDELCQVFIANVLSFKRSKT